MRMETDNGEGILCVQRRGRSEEAGSAKAGRLWRWRAHPGSAALALLVWLAGLITMLFMLLLVGFIVGKGVSHLRPSLFALTYNSENASLMPALINTLVVTVFALLIAIPFGVFAAIYLVEYAGKGSRIVRLIRITTETLSGIPSIIYGLFGRLCFCIALRLGYSLLAGSLTLVIMILPLIIRTSEEAMLAVPDAYREASYGLGAGRLRTIFRVVLPAGVPGILSGVVLATGRIVGETAALLYTAGTVAKIPGLLGSGRTLAVHMYVLSSEGLYMDQAYATAVILLLFVLALNGLSGLLARGLMRGQGK